MRYKLLALLFMVGVGLIITAPTATAAPEGQGTLTVAEASTCDGSCHTFFFSGTGGIGDFTLSAVRPTRTYDSSDFALNAGVYKVTQFNDEDFPLGDARCTSDRRNLSTSRSGLALTV